MPKATYRVQLKRSEYVQVDIESDDPLTILQVEERATAQANREFGQMDEAEIIGIELSVPIGKVAANGQQ